MGYSTMQQLVKTYLPEQQAVLDQLFAAERSLNKAQPTAVVYGLYNSGKSSLLNSITNNIEQEYFATGDIPQTKAMKQLVYQGMCYIDTPGLDVDYQDTACANQGINEADILILVHKLTSGPIQRNELHTIQQLIARHGRPAHVITVLTGAEQVESKQTLIADITQQLKPFIPNNNVFPVSNHTFAKGVQQAKQPLIQHSGMPQLIQYLQDKVGELKRTLKHERLARKMQLKNSLLDEIKHKKSLIKQTIQRNKDYLAERENRLLAVVKDLQKLAR